MRSLFLCFLGICGCFQAGQGASSSSFTATEERDVPLLIYNMFPPSFGMQLGAGLGYWDNMTAYLPVVKDLGFNAVWLNPFTETPNYSAKIKFDVGIDYDVLCSHSLYSPYDLSRIEGEPTAESTGDPGHASPIAIEKITKFTAEAKSLGIETLFDLAVAWIPDSSKLASGKCPHFIDKGIDTSKWFSKDSGCCWNPRNGTKIIDYGDPAIGKEVAEYLWKPFIVKMIDVFGFTGVRFDFAAALPFEIEKLCVDYIRDLNPQATIFGEMLVSPGIDISWRKSCGFSHITNNILWVNRKCGEVYKKAFNYFLHDQGVKKNMCTKIAGKMSGTIGFAGSHDDGTALQAGCRTKERSCGDFEDFWGPINKALSILSEPQKLRLAKERIGTAALASEAGYFLLSGDESLSVLKKIVFLDTGTLPRDRSEDHFYTPAFRPSPSVTELRNFIRQINQTFSTLRSARETFWIEMIDYQHRFNDAMVFVRHLSEGRDGPTDIVFADFTSKETVSRMMRRLSREAIKQFVCEKTGATLPEDTLVYIISPH